MSTERSPAFERIRAADRALVDVELDPGADARIRARLAAQANPRRARTRRFVLAGAVAAAVGLAAWITRPPPTALPTCTAEPARSRCAVAWSGSRIVVEPGGLLTAGPGAVRLSGGRARFEVESRALGAEPYRVRAAGATIEVLGTAFTVTARDAGGAVELHHGRIAVTTPNDRRVIVDRPGRTLRWSVSPAAPASPAPPGAAAPPAAPAPPLSPPPATAPRQVSPEAQAPAAEPAEARIRPRRPPATAAELARVVALRRDGRPEQALALVERLARRANDPVMAEALSVERGDLLGGPLRRRAAACAHWRRHIARHADGPLRGAADASMSRLRCGAP